VLQLKCARLDGKRAMWCRFRRLLITRTRMPDHVSHRVNTKPVGSAPTMRMLVSFSVTTFLIQYGIQEQT